MPLEDLSSADCLIAVDVQNDFMPGGALAVPDGDAVVPIVNRLSAVFPAVVATQDWHPADHRSFASAHPAHAAFDTVGMPYGPQVLWPDHCIQGSDGAAFHSDFLLDRCDLILRKGSDREIDSYSAFVENDRTTRTGLASYLRERGITRVFVAGLATDFCVAWSVIDARAAGFEAVLIEDGCRAIDLDGSLAAALNEVRKVGARIIQASDIRGF